MFQHMRYIYEVYRAKSISKAAEKLYISQPSLSAIVKKTELRIGSKLFDRSSNPLGLTQCGEKYIKCAEKIMDVENEFSNYLNDVEDLNIGGLKIGASNFFSAYILPPIITRFKAAYPHITIDLIETESIRAQKLLLAGELDMIIDNSDLNENTYGSCTLSTETLILAVPVQMVPPDQKAWALTAQDVRDKKHFDAQTQAVKLTSFANLPCVVLRQGNDTRDRFDRIKKDHGYPAQIILELDQLATAYHVACQGLGITVTSDALIDEVPLDDRLAFFRIDSDDIHRESHFYYKQGKYLSKAMLRFMEFASA